jgi:hypothetical protein
MTSVRVRRGQYATLTDPNGPYTRPRSRSLATVLGTPSFPSTPPLSALSADQDVARARANTVSGNQDGPPPMPRRASSKIHEHIMGRRTRANSQHQHHHPEHGSRSPRSDESRRRSDEVSLRGSTENVVYRGEGGSFGRIGSALSLCEGQEDDQHHTDDIVDHLDVIGTTSAESFVRLLIATALQILPLLQFPR